MCSGGLSGYVRGHSRSCEFGFLVAVVFLSAHKESGIGASEHAYSSPILIKNTKRNSRRASLARIIKPPDLKYRAFASSLLIAHISFVVRAMQYHVNQVSMFGSREGRAKDKGKAHRLCP